MAQMNDCMNTAAANEYWSLDYSHLPILQENQKERAETMRTLTLAVEKQWRLNAITYNQMLEMLGRETVSNGDYRYFDTEMGKAEIASMNNKTNGNGQQN